MTDLLRTCTLEEAADRLGISVRKLYDMRQAGQIRTVQFGRMPVIPMSEIARLLNPVDGPVDGFRQNSAEKIELFPKLSA
jgi:excisionase family DNA binding protein